YYFLVQTSGVASGATVDVVAEYLDLRIHDVIPDEIGRSGPVTVTIFGAGLPSGIDDDDVWLRPVADPSQFFLPLSGTVERLGSTEVRATFDLLGAATGDYEIVVRVPATGPPTTGACTAPDCAAAAITVAPTVPPSVALTTTQAINFRASSFALLRTDLTNLGNVDAEYIVASLRTPTIGDREIVTGTVPFGAWQAFGADSEVRFHTVVLRSLPPGQPARIDTVLDLESPLGGVALITDQCDLTRYALVLSAEEFAAWQEDRALATFDAVGSLATGPWAGLTEPEWIDQWRDALAARDILPSSIVAGSLPSVGPLMPGACPSTEVVEDFGDFLADHYALTGTAPLLPTDAPDELLIALEHALAGFATERRCESVPIFAAIDPNEKTTGTGVGASRFVGLGQRIDYAIYFENEGGTSPASRVEIHDTLSEDLLLGSVRFGDITLGDQFFDVPDDQVFHTELYSPLVAGSLEVRATMFIDPEAHEVVWILEAIDPASGLPPEDATVGWLPAGAGGSVHFSVRSTLASGGPPRPLPNSANIIFDGNTPVTTAPVENVLDPNAPVFTSAMVTLTGNTLEASWVAEEPLEESGVESFAIAIESTADDAGVHPATSSPWSITLTDPSALLAVTLRAVDRVGNVGEETTSFVGDPFVRGDCNTDGLFDVSDPVFVLAQQFIIGAPASTCSDACDANDDGMVDVSDPVYMLAASFIIGSPQPP
ncbi:MAG: dockerin type I repeat-containing protein, partial [Planctomycetes bacterium]|nr:dockerin type I repeat-containing protein [Planctomycetota bacterium]